MKKAATHSPLHTTARIETPKNLASSLDEIHDAPEPCSEESLLSFVAIESSRNAAAIINVFQKFGDKVNFTDVSNHIDTISDGVSSGNLSVLEHMLVAQSLALQTLFTSLTRRASVADTLSQYQTYMGLGLRAQSQSRATIQAVVDLKFPRQVSFVKQANIANGPQQVNNGEEHMSLAHEKNAQITQTKVLESEYEHGLDAGTSTTTIGKNSALEAVATVHRAAHDGGQGEGKPKRVQGRRTRQATKNRKAA